ncbi:MAG: EpsG family protein [Bacteroidales bacterium]|nr:EpsG family protein [Bacteroidales bacterium]
MALAFIVLIYLFFLLLFQNSKNYKEKVFRLYLYIIAFLLIQYLRIYCQQFFPDIPNYRILFDNVDTLFKIIRDGINYEILETTDSGYIILNSIVKTIINSYDFFLFVVSLIELLCIYAFCKKYELPVLISFIIYFALTYLTFQIGMLRQAIAFSFLLLAMVKFKNVLLYVFLIALGSTFHKSLIPAIFLLFFRIKVNYKYLFYFFCGSIIIYILKIDLIPHISRISTITEEIIEAGRVGHYYKVFVIENNYLGIGFWDRLIQGIILYIIYKDLDKKNKVKDKHYILYCFGMLSFFIQMILFNMTTITSRLRYYFELFPLFLIANYLYVEYRGKYASIYKIILLLYCALYLYFQGGYLYL